MACPDPRGDSSALPCCIHHRFVAPNFSPAFFNVVPNRNQGCLPLIAPLLVAFFLIAFFADESCGKDFTYL